jgi:exonuclease VII small subunit
LDFSEETMQEMNAQMALRLHQMTGEPLVHCSYLLGQTNGDYETALKILERILQQRNTGTGNQTSDDRDAPSSAAPGLQEEPETLEERVARLESQLVHLTTALDTISETLTLLLDKLSGPDAV